MKSHIPNHHRIFLGMSFLFHLITQKKICFSTVPASWYRLPSSWKWSVINAWNVHAHNGMLFKTGRQYDVDGVYALFRVEHTTGKLSEKAQNFTWKSKLPLDNHYISLNHLKTFEIIWKPYLVFHIFWNKRPC